VQSDLPNALTGVYATDPQYGQKLIMIMQHFNLEQYDKPKQLKPPISSAEKNRRCGDCGHSERWRNLCGPQHMHIAYRFDVNLIIACFGG
jgi:hypothetical protein